MRLYGQILSLILLAATVTGCGLFTPENPKLSSFALKTDKELEEMSEADLKEIAQIAFGDQLYRVDPKAIDQMIADPAKMRRDLAALMPRTFGAFVAAGGFTQDVMLQMANVSVKEEEAALRRYRDALFTYYDPITKDRREALRRRFGDWFDYLAPEVQQQLVWNDAEFERAMTDDAYAIRLVNAGIAYQDHVLNSDLFSTQAQDDAYYLLEQVNQIRRQYGGMNLPPATGSTRISP